MNTEQALRGEPRRSNAGLFAVAGLAAVLALYYFSSHSLGSLGQDKKLQLFKSVFLSLILEALPFILIGVLISALLQAYVSDRFIRRLIPRNPVLGIVAAAALGIVFPICECGMVPAVRQLIKKGMPTYAATAFVLAGPILNPIVFWSTWTAFRGRPEMTYARMGLAFAIALVVGLLVCRFVKTGVLRERTADAGRSGHAHAHDHAHDHGGGSATPRSRLEEATGHMVSEFFDMGKYLLFGAMLVGLLQTLVPQERLVALGHGEGGSSLLMMGLGFMLSLCSTSDAFVAQSFQASFAKEALLGFMVFGPMLNLKSLLMMLAVFRTKFVVLIATLVFALVYAGTWIAGLWIGG